ncbi:hypothetical protein ACEWPM_009090 [Roseovarius sp. S4756]|uniref:hypothetical protein n=1 Tax=Roseovarius maritimus TaxID=3342637 RepID=UPI00372882AD
MSEPGAYTSPPCMAGEVDPIGFHQLGEGSEQARGIGRETVLAGYRHIKAELDLGPHLTTIYPHPPHDIPLDLIATKAGVTAERDF